MVSSKTTLYLPNSLRARLKALAARQGTTMSELLAEGAESVLARRQGLQDRDELAARASEAERELRAGLYRGPAVACDVDGLLYGRATRRRTKRR